MRPRARPVPPARRPAAAAALVALVALAGCGADEMETAMAQPAASSGRPAALVCAKDAESVELPASFPPQATVPAGFVVTGTESRSGGRTVLTAVSPEPFRQTLEAMQRAYSTRGWTSSEGEVEHRDAESNFHGNGLRGRWAIREMPDCSGNTSVSVLIGK